jgi:hypothetical protein
MNLSLLLSTRVPQKPARPRPLQPGCTARASYPDAQISLDAILINYRRPEPSSGVRTRSATPATSAPKNKAGIPKWNARYLSKSHS